MRLALRRLLPAALIATGLGPLTLAACDSTAPDDGAGEEEFFTAVTLTLTPATGGPPVTLVASDPDGDQVGIVYTQSAPLAAGTYSGAITLRDDLNGADVTPEVVAERDAHQFFYAFTPSSGVSRVAVSNRSLDANGFPFGHTFTLTVTAGTGGNGTLRAVLAHYGAGVKGATDTIDLRPGSDTDLDLAYPLALQ